MKPRILVASIVNQDERVFEGFCTALKTQTRDFDADLAYAFRFDPSADNAQTLLDAAHARFKNFRGSTFRMAGEKPSEAKYGVQESTHQWSKETFHWLAREKQKLLDLTVEERYDAVWLLDSDLLCDPYTLRSLWEAEGPVVSGVFWTAWQLDAPPLPQVWARHPYEFAGMGYEGFELLTKLDRRELIPVAGLGACTLIRAEAARRAKFWPLQPGLPEGNMWQGEDRHFCISASKNHVGLYADAWPNIWHCYRPSQIDDIPAVLRSLDSRPAQAGFGDLVSLVLEPLEAPQVAGYSRSVRGRLGSLPLMPELEETLIGMEPGTERVVDVSFPPWYPYQPYQGKARVIRIKLLDVKHHGLHPTLSEPADAALEAFWVNSDLGPAVSGV